MPSLRDQLHDEVDAIEEITNRTRADVISILDNELPKAIEGSGDIVAALVAVTELIENRLADLTTEAYESGVETAKKRVAVDSD